jgi:hypothetical protein
MMPGNLPSGEVLIPADSIIWQIRGEIRLFCLFVPDKGAFYFIQGGQQF